MPRVKRAERRKHLIILLIALLTALGIMLIQAETANAQPGSSLDDSAVAELVSQVSDADYQSVLTTERLLLLGMLGLVVLTWFYLRWRPPPGYEREPDQDRPPE